MPRQPSQPPSPAVTALLAWRGADRLTQPEAARRLGVPLRTLQSWEYTGRCALPGLLLIAIYFLWEKES